MICNFHNISQHTKHRQLDTCHHKSKIGNSTSTLTSKSHCQASIENTAAKMSTLTKAIAATAANKNQPVKPPLEAVVVNSIIYSKPSFCSISVDFGNITPPVNENASLKTNLTNGTTPNNINCFSETICTSSMDLENSDFKFDAASCLADFAATSSLNMGEDAKLYRMCTTMNGSIHHQISDLCDNILAMTGIFDTTNNEDDDDSFIEFAYRDTDDADDGGDDVVDFLHNEYDCDDDDNDVVNFSYDCLNEPEPKLDCDKKKKVRFDTKPTVHIMHTWKFAYHAARKGDWEMYARDRERFKLRIQRTALTLNPILAREHRQKIYGNRFANIYNEDNGGNEILNDTKSNKALTNIESKKAHQKKKRKKKRFCKMGNKHYF